MAEISFLHFTDLHWGQNGFGHYWPTYKTKLREDLKKMRKTVGKNWDFVLFTGDLAFSGQSNEYETLTEVLQEVWEWFKEDGSEPLFIPVPGNHDLQRLDDTDPVAISLSCWEDKPNLRQEFWSNPDSEYRKALREAFLGYTEWLGSKPVPMPDNIKSGILPGDFSLSISLNDFKLGIVGLNSAFLQLTQEDFRKKIVLSAKQIIPIMDSSPDDWCKKHHFNIFMTHHNPSWLSESSMNEFRAEIYPPNRFNLHIFGHLHEAMSIELSEGGSTSRKYRQGPSLLGLEKYGTSNEIRAHGYIANKIEIHDTTGTERYWPRILVKKAGGYHGFDPDTKFERDSDDSVSSVFKLTQGDKPDLIETAIESNQADFQNIAADDDVIHLIEENNDSLEQDLTVKDEEKSSTLPRFIWKLHSHHQAIRQAEQASLEKAILEKRCGIIVSDWGLGKIGFIGTVLARLEKTDPVEVFKVSCSETETLEQMDTIFRQQLGFSIQETMNLLSILPRPVLFMDDFSPNLLEEISAKEQPGETFLQPLLDFCPTLLIILATRQAPKNPLYGVIHLRALEIPDTKLYTQKHDITVEELKDPSIIEAIHMKSDGLPMHLDMIIEQLQVSSLNEILTLDDGVSSLDKESEPVPIALQKAVRSLAASNDKYKIRSFKLLQVLSFLPAGESLSALKRVFPTQPFFPQNAVDLYKFDLVQTENPMEFTKTEDHASDLFHSGITVEEKRLVVPRQVRDYVKSITPEADLIDITRATLFLMFGDNWLSGDASLQPKRKWTLRGVRGLGPGNEHAVAVSYLRQSIKENEPVKIRKAIKLAISLTSAYADASKYRDCSIVADEYLSITTGLLTEEENKHLSILLARGLRMTGKSKKSLALLESVIENNDESITKNERAEIELLRALILRKNRDNDGALEAANRVLKLASKGSSRHDHALSVIVGLENYGKERMENLVRLEKEVRDRDNLVVANNIALEIYSELTNEDAKSAALERVIKCKTDPYNKIRALVNKAKLANNNGSSISLSVAEKEMLKQAYSFLFTQRLGNLFDECHKVLWKLFKNDENLNCLLLMFRLSSFVWRLQGDIETEKTYAIQIRETVENGPTPRTQRKVIMAFEYFKKRLGFFISNVD